MSDININVTPPTAPPEVIILGSSPKDEPLEKLDRLEDGIPVCLFKTGVRVEIKPGIYKMISYDDFLSDLRSNRDALDGDISAGRKIFLPTGCFYLETSATAIKLSCFYPEKVENISFMGTVRKSVIPNIIISSILYGRGEEFTLQEAKYFVSKNPFQSIRREFVTSNCGYPYLPFTNVYDDGRLCYGTAMKASKYKLPDLRPIHSLYQVLFDSDFNNDLGLRNLKSETYRSNGVNGHRKWYELLEHLAKTNKPFPYEEVRGY